jgi:ArsR family transcriptional regulator
MNEPLSSLKLFKIIGDENRLKILMILQNAEFTVGELVQLLNIHQSNASRHLSQLREGKLVEDRKEGALVYYRWTKILRQAHNLQELLQGAWEQLSDRERLNEAINNLLRQRKLNSQSFFDKVAGQYHQLAQPGGGARALLTAFAHLLEVDTCADIGAGEGELSLLLSRSAKKLLAVDFNDKMLEIISQRAQAQNIHNIETRHGDIDELPIEDSSVDLAVLSQVLHHLPTPEKSFAEVKRILKENGKLLLLDLDAHDQDWVREKLGDQWLGFSPDRLSAWIKNSGLQVLHSERISINEGLPVLLIIAGK